MQIKRFRQHLRDRSRIRAFNLKTVQRKHRLSVPENRHGWRGGRYARQQFTYPRNRIYIRARKDAGRRIRSVWMVKR